MGVFFRQQCNKVTCDTLLSLNEEECKQKKMQTAGIFASVEQTATCILSGGHYILLLTCRTKLTCLMLSQFEQFNIQLGNQDTQGYGMPVFASL